MIWSNWAVGENRVALKTHNIGTALMAVSVILATVPAEARSGLAIDGASGEKERAALTRWIGETDAILSSDAFRKNLLSLKGDHPQVYFDQNPDGTPLLKSIDDLVRALRPEEGFRYLPVSVALVGTNQNISNDIDWTALTGWTGYADDGGFSLASLALGRKHLANWLADDVVQRSCAVNTLAHEVTHTISTHHKFYNVAFTDLARRSAPAGVPAASYLVGTTAQCTWLQQQGRVTAAGFKSCVAVFGSRHFNSARCTSFGGGQPVIERPDLPAVAID